MPDFKLQPEGTPVECVPDTILNKKQKTRLAERGYKTLEQLYGALYRDQMQFRILLWLSKQELEAIKHYLEHTLPKEYVADVQKDDPPQYGMGALHPRLRPKGD
ncbi:MAG: hypothetical protein KGI50_01890 [Patescibacteria group bacterium]|nr:hypothetical protein [Patescibacteria group bacterium]MDE2437904.1 hypothetical protein [Patescibacteria group bacterium]